MDAARVKELGTTVVATYDTTALSLMWALVLLEGPDTGEVREQVAALARGDGGCPHRDGGLSVIDLAVLEAVRLGGSNPSALWRRTTRPLTLRHAGRSVTVPANTMMWLDRRQANHDPGVFPRPCVFAPANIRAIARSDRETVSSLLSRNRYEINSFSMVNAHRNPRKCPGRLFSVHMQSLVLTELYGRYEVTVRDADPRLRRFSSMPRPARAGTITLSPLAAVPARTEQEPVP
ncbi:cytochrome P450 [Streptomyces somaliensis DSM 40738]|uniref:cytochrome P450 n=1 Tax=Streptomyces somaliensis TaxID=78355 RepID=UPI0021C41C80|nr:cytochrome P450 [Streptomyces somaliensis]MCQ0023688.1 cytochrome P450 [Streptomyces somaliensis DSM 40738]